MTRKNAVCTTVTALFAGGCLVLSGADAVSGADAPAAVGTNAVAELPMKEVLRLADEARGNLKGVRWTVDIDAAEGQTRQASSLDVRARGYDFLAMFLSPPKVRDQRVLFVERNMWFAKPGVRKPVPISPRQKLMGGVAYGDIAATNYSDDYTAERLADETVEGAACYVFDLKAANQRCTYDRIKYWVSKERNVAVQAEYYTVSGKLFKSARFEFDHRIPIEGKERLFISRIVIRDAVMKDNVTTMAFGQPAFGSISDATFDVNLLMAR